MLDYRIPKKRGRRFCFPNYCGCDFLLVWHELAGGGYQWTDFPPPADVPAIVLGVIRRQPPGESGPWRCASIFLETSDTLGSCF